MVAGRHRMSQNNAAPAATRRTTPAPHAVFLAHSVSTLYDLNCYIDHSVTPFANTLVRIIAKSSCLLVLIKLLWIEDFLLLLLMLNVNTTSNERILNCFKDYSRVKLSI